MKNNILIMLVTLFSYAAGNAQPDSARTMNAKPGTPGSLRKAPDLPADRVPVINGNANAAQTINHEGTESNKVIHKKDLYVIPYSNSPYRSRKVTDQFNINAKPVENRDGSLGHKPPVVSNPIHK